MGALRTVEPTDATEPAGGGRRLQTRTVMRAALLVAFLLVVLFVLPAWLNSYWLLIMTGVVIYSIVTLGLGLLIGRVGLVSLCQFVLLAVGAWFALRVNQLVELPFPILLIVAGLGTAVIGTLIGLPALRLSGLYLALITLMAAGALTVLLLKLQFPNGGGGFDGNDSAGGPTSFLPRPSLAHTDTGYYRYCVFVAVVMFVVAFLHVRAKAGRAWAAIRQSEATAVSAGVHTTVYKLWAFALAAFMTGVAGGLLAAATGGVNINQFQVQGSITLFAVTMMGGVYSLAGAVVGAVMLRLLPALLDDWGLGTELLTVLFGVGVIQVLLTAPGGLVEQVPKDLGNLGKKLWSLVAPKREPSPEIPAPPVQVSEPTVTEPTA
jgi:branched-chain amino acid transport system permease protein